MRLASGASIAALATLLAGSAEAMPTPAPYRGDSLITLAAGGCGYYWHRNVYGACVPNGPGWGGGGVVVAPGYYGGYGGPGYWHGGYYHGGGVSYHYHYHYNYHTSYHTGGWHGGGWHGGGAHWHGGGGHWHGGGGGGHWHGGGHRR
jgi:hypothetical protein